MKALSIILILSVFAFSCKSIKKQKSETMMTVSAAFSTAALDSMVIYANTQAKSQEEEELQETTQHSFVSFDSAGLTIFKPVTIITTKKKSTKTTHSSADSTEARVIKSETSDQSDSSHYNATLDKASESEQVIKQVADSLFPKWGKILASILLAVVPVMWGIWKKKNQVE